MKPQEIFEEDVALGAIDNAIIGLSSMRKGGNASKEIIEKGIKAIEFLINLSREAETKIQDVESELKESGGHKSLFKGQHKIQLYRDDLSKALSSLKNINPSDSSRLDEIEEIQELLLKISLPVWKQQFPIQTRKRFRPIEL